MTVHYKTEGFVFKGLDRLEADKVFSVFTLDFGRIEVFGKSIRKIDSKLKSGIEIFSLSEIAFIQGRNKKTLTDALFVDKFKNIKQNPEKFEIVKNISNLVDNFIKNEEKDLEVFDLLNDSFGKLNDNLLPVSYCPFIYYYFFWNFISVLGHKPELSKCVSCYEVLNPEKLYFSNNDGGVVCLKCYSDQKRDLLDVNSDTVKILRLIIKKDWSILSKLKIEKNNIKLLDKISGDYLKFLLSNYSNQNL